MAFRKAGEILALGKNLEIPHTLLERAVENEATHQYYFQCCMQVGDHALHELLPSHQNTNIAPALTSVRQRRSARPKLDHDIGHKPQANPACDNKF